VSDVSTPHLVACNLNLDFNIVRLQTLMELMQCLASQGMTLVLLVQQGSRSHDKKGRVHQEQCALSDQQAMHHHYSPTLLGPDRLGAIALNGALRCPLAATPDTCLRMALAISGTRGDKIDTKARITTLMTLGISSRRTIQTLISHQITNQHVKHRPRPGRNHILHISNADKEGGVLHHSGN
jgi:hypothetical protein